MKRDRSDPPCVGGERGQVQIRADHVASTWRPTAVWLLASQTWTGPRPINAYVIEHRDGLVLFDTGQDRASVTGSVTSLAV